MCHAPRLWAELPRQVGCAPILLIFVRELGRVKCQGTRQSSCFRHCRGCATGAPPLLDWRSLVSCVRSFAERSPRHTGLDPDPILKWLLPDELGFPTRRQLCWCRLATSSGRMAHDVASPARRCLAGTEPLPPPSLQHTYIHMYIHTHTHTHTHLSFARESPPATLWVDFAPVVDCHARNPNPDPGCRYGGTSLRRTGWGGRLVRLQLPVGCPGGVRG